jgi:hypothetical protein
MSSTLRDFELDFDLNRGFLFIKIRLVKGVFVGKGVIENETKGGKLKNKGEKAYPSSCVFSTLRDFDFDSDLNQ